MKRFLLWSFERGSNQYDVICGIILAFIFLTPPSAFQRSAGLHAYLSRSVHQTTDDNGNTVFTVKVETPAFSAEEVNRKAAEGVLRG